MSRTLVHRASMTGRPVCGADGLVRISSSGACVTCPKCAEADKPRPSVTDWLRSQGVAI